MSNLEIKDAEFRWMWDTNGMNSEGAKVKLKDELNKQVNEKKIMQEREKEMESQYVLQSMSRLDRENQAQKEKDKKYKDKLKYEAEVREKQHQQS